MLRHSRYSERRLFLFKSTPKKALIFTLSFLMAYTPSALVYSRVASDSMEPVVNMSRLATLNDFAEGSQLRLQMGSFEATQEAIASNNITALKNADVIDPTLITDQTLLLYKEGKVVSRHHLADNNRTYKPPVFNEFDLVVKEGVLTLQGFVNSKLVAEQTYDHLKADSVIYDKDMALVSTKKGEFYVMDMGYMEKSAFNGPVPMFKLLRQGDPNLSDGQFEMRFISRGQVPILHEQILAEEKRTGLKNEAVPRDGKGNVLFTAGDVVVFDTRSGKPVYSFLLNRNAIEENIRRGTIILSVMVFMLNQEGMTTTFAEQYESRMRIETNKDAESPLHQLKVKLGLLGADPALDGILRQFLDQSDNNLDTLKLFLKTIDREGLKTLIGREDRSRLREGRQRDKFTLSDWYASYEKIRAQAEAESEKLGALIDKIEERRNMDLSGLPKNISQQYQKVVRLKTAVELEDLKAKKDLLDRQLGTGHFYESQAPLMRALLQQRSTFHANITPWHQKINWKKLRSTAVRLAAISTVGIGAVAGASSLSPEIANGVSITMNWFYNLAIPEVYVRADHIEAALGYKYSTPVWNSPLTWGNVFWLSLIPVAYLFGMASVHMLKGSAYMLRSGHPDLAARVDKFANQLKPLNTWQRIITMNMRPWAYVILLLSNHIQRLTRQQFVDAIKQDTKPWMKIKGDSVLGKKVGLQPGQDVRLGFNGNFINEGYGSNGEGWFNIRLRTRDEVEAQHNLMRTARTNVRYNQRQAQRYAWHIALAVVSSESGIDPATITLILNGDIDFDEIERIQQDPRLSKLWKRTALAVNKHIWDLIKSSPDFNVDSLKREQVEEVVREASIIVEKIKKRARVLNAALDLGRTFKNIGKGFFKFAATFGHKEFEFLKTMIASKFTARQTSTFFVQDHAWMTGFGSLYGPRADADQVDKLAYTETGHPVHATGLGMNYINIILAGGARRALVFQQIKEHLETDYAPIRTSVLTSALKPDSFFRGMMNWTVSVFNPVKSNLGGYLVRDFFKSLAAIQGGLILGISARMGFKGADFADAFSSSIYYWLAVPIFFGWMHLILNRGNHNEENRLAEHSARQRIATDGLAEALQNKDEEGIRRHAQDLINLMDPNYVKKHFAKTLSQSGLSRRERGQFLAKVKQQLNTENAKYVMYAYHGVKTAVEEGNLKLARDFVRYLQNGLESGQFQKVETQMDYTRFAERVGDMILEGPVLHNAPSRRVSFFTTLLFGVIGTTIAGTYLLDSSDARTITMNDIGFIALMQATFMTVFYTVFSKYLWEKYYIPKIDKFFERQASKLRDQGRRDWLAERYLKKRNIDRFSCKSAFTF